MAIDCQEVQMPRISYVEPSTVTDPGLAALLEESRTYGTPRLQSQAIRAHLPAGVRTFAGSCHQGFRGVPRWRPRSPDKGARPGVRGEIPGLRVLRWPAVAHRGRPGSRRA